MNYFYNCCNKANYLDKFIYTSPPKGENSFKIKNYYRIFKICKRCNHFLNFHNYNLEKIYKNDYFKTIYKNGKALKKNFIKIVNLPKKKSDNFHRVKRILKFIKLKKKYLLQI